MPPRLGNRYVFVKIPPDGRCFWTGVWLGAFASKHQLLAWHRRPRNASGYTFGEDVVREKNMVMEWAMWLTSMPEDTHDRLEKGISSTREDIEA